MKLNKSTTILLNAVLILVMFFLLKTLISTPKQLYAATSVEYTVRDNQNDLGNAADICNKLGKEGWKLVAVAGATTMYFMR